MWMRVIDIADSKNSMHYLALVIQELAIAQALVMVHGHERGARIYGERGLVKFDPDGEPCIWVDDTETNENRTIGHDAVPDGTDQGGHPGSRH